MAIVRVCSMTKPVTSVAVMVLYEQGRLLLEDPVPKYLPSFADPRVRVAVPGRRDGDPRQPAPAVRPGQRASTHPIRPELQATIYQALVG